MTRKFWTLAAAMMFSCILSPLAFGQANYDESKVGTYQLPDPLVCLDGTVVKTAEQWEKVRRPEILEMFQREMFGRLPKELIEAGNHPDFVTFKVFESSNDALGGKAIRKQVEITFHELDYAKTKKDSGREVKANLLIYIPKNASGPVPAFLGCNFLGNHTITPEKEIALFHLRNGSMPKDDKNLKPEDSRGYRVNRWDVDQILDAGYALATLHYMDVTFDERNGIGTGIFSLYGDSKATEERTPDAWGSITAWAWGLSRALDYLETDEHIDASRVAVMGHSRLGKTSLWAGASDPRFAVVISNNSGCGGSALSRRNYGETLTIINRNFPHWFAKNFRQYNADPNTLPIDEHELIALMAPRPVYVASAKEDRWANPKGEYLSVYHAVPVYELYGEKPFDGLSEPAQPAVDQPVFGKKMGYHIRTGGHDVKSYDWTQYIRFADQFLKK